VCENEQKPELEPLKSESSGTGATLMKPRAPELEPEPCSWKEELWSWSCVIFMTSPQP